MFSQATGRSSPRQPPPIPILRSQDHFDSCLLEALLIFVNETLGGRRASRATYILKWLAHALRSPEERRPALILLGASGSGKSIFVNFLQQKVWKMKTAIITSSTRNLSRIAQGRLLCIIEDLPRITISGFPMNELSFLITSRSLTNDSPEGVKQVDNHASFILTSRYVDCLGLDARDWKYAVFKLSTKHIGDRDRARALLASLTQEVAEHFIAYLDQLDLTNFDVWEPPRTEALKRMVACEQAYNKTLLTSHRPSPRSRSRSGDGTDGTADGTADEADDPEDAFNLIERRRCSGYPTPEIKASTTPELRPKTPEIKASTTQELRSTTPEIKASTTPELGPTAGVLKYIGAIKRGEHRLWVSGESQRVVIRNQRYAITTNDFYEDYEKWCRVNSSPIYYRNRFLKTILQIFPDSSPHRGKVGKYFYLDKILGHELHETDLPNYQKMKGGIEVKPPLPPRDD